MKKNIVKLVVFICITLVAVTATIATKDFAGPAIFMLTALLLFGLFDGFDND